jgi:hypothetical protein
MEPGEGLTAPCAKPLRLDPAGRLLAWTRLLDELTSSNGRDTGVAGREPLLDTRPVSGHRRHPAAVPVWPRRVVTVTPVSGEPVERVDCDYSPASLQPHGPRRGGRNQAPPDCGQAVVARSPTYAPPGSDPTSRRADGRTPGGPITPGGPSRCDADRQRSRRAHSSRAAPGSPIRRAAGARTPRDTRARRDRSSSSTTLPGAVGRSTPGAPQAQAPPRARS